MSTFEQMMQKISEYRNAIQAHFVEANREVNRGHLIGARKQYDFARQTMTELSDLLDDAVLAREEEREEKASQSKPAGGAHSLYHDFEGEKIDEPLDAGATMARHKEILKGHEDVWKRKDPGEKAILEGREDPGEVIPPYRSPYQTDSLRIAADELADEETFGAGPNG